MARSSDRRTHFDKVLGQLVSIRGVTSALLVDPDGLVVHMRKDFDLDADAVAPSVQIMLGAATTMGERTSHGNTNLVLAEATSGMSVVAPLSNDFTLAVITDNDAMLGAVRFEVKEAVGALNKAF